MRITIVGGTGYTGANIARIAAARGPQVTSLSRHEPTEPVPGVSYRTGSVLDPAVRQQAVADTDVLVLAASPRGNLLEAQTEVYQAFLELADAAGVRLFVIGGYSTLRPAPGAPRILEAGQFPPEFAREIQAGADNLDALLAAPDSLDWVYVSPAGSYGAHTPGEATGHYRKGGEIALVDQAGNSAISGADFALGVVDAIEAGTDHRAHLSFAY
ncbi:MAG: NAD(P)H-binding protein [Propionicimonas sp.]|nr:NAD(P)H-binding protein [Propionicimonas sp.]